MDRPPRPRRTDPQRQQHVAAIIARLRRAMQDDPLLVRLPSERELGRLLRAPRRQVHDALAVLAAEGLIRPLGRQGYRVAKRPTARSAQLHTVIFAAPVSASTVPTFVQYAVLGIEAECRKLGLKFRYQHLQPQARTESLEAAMADEPAAGVGWLIAVRPSPAQAETWLNAGRRFVLMDCLSTQIQLPAVLLNQAAAVELAVAHLRKLGHQRTALIYRATSPILPLLLRQLKEKNIAEAVSDQNLAISGSEDLSTFLRQWIRRWEENSRRPAAAIVHDLACALLFLDLCRARDVDVPGELTLLAVGSNYGRGTLPITLASAGRAEEFGKLAVDTLLAPDVMQTRPVVTTEATLEMPGLTTRRLRLGNRRR